MAPFSPAGFVFPEHPADSDAGTGGGPALAEAAPNDVVVVVNPAAIPAPPQPDGAEAGTQGDEGRTPLDVPSEIESLKALTWAFFILVGPATTVWVFCGDPNVSALTVLAGAAEEIFMFCVYYGVILCAVACRCVPCICRCRDWNAWLAWRAKNSFITFIAFAFSLWWWSFSITGNCRAPHHRVPAQNATTFNVTQPA